MLNESVPMDVNGCDQRTELPLKNLTVTPKIELPSWKDISGAIEKGTTEKINSPYSVYVSYSSGMW